MPVVAESTFTKSLREKTRAGVYLLYGEENYLLLKAVEQLKKQGESAPFPEFNLMVLDGDTATAEAIADACESLPFLAQEKIVLVNDWNPEQKDQGQVEQLAALLSAVQESTLLVLYTLGNPIGKYPSKKWKTLLSVSALQQVEFRCKTDSELIKYLQKYAEKQGCTLERPLATAMLERCGRDLSTLLQELGKWCSYAQSGTLTKEQMLLVTTANRESQVFQLAKDVLWGKREQAFATLQDLLAQNEEPVMLLSLLASSYLTLYRVKCMIESNQPLTELKTPFGYGGKEFLLRNAEQDCNRFSSQVLEESLQYLLEADLALKGGAGSSRGMVKETVLDTLLTKLLLLHG